MKLFLFAAFLYAVCSAAPAAPERLSFFGTPLDLTPPDKLPANKTVQPSDTVEPPAPAPGQTEQEPELKAIEAKIRDGESVLREIFDKRMQDLRKEYLEEVTKAEALASTSKKQDVADFLKNKRSSMAEGRPLMLGFSPGQPGEWQTLVKSGMFRLDAWRSLYRQQSTKLAAVLRTELKQTAKTLEEKKKPVAAARAAQLARGLQPWFDLRGDIWGGKSSLTDKAGAQGGGPFCHVPGEGGILTGFYYTTFESCIGSLTPIYMTAHGRIKGTTFGKQRSVVKRIEALPGYAVAGIVPATSNRLNRLRVVFMRLKENEAGFDPKFRYVTDFFGGSGGKEGKPLGENGRLVTGICGRCGDDVDAVGLVQVQ